MNLITNKFFFILDNYKKLYLVFIGLKIIGHWQQEFLH